MSRLPWRRGTLAGLTLVALAAAGCGSSSSKSSSSGSSANSKNAAPTSAPSNAKKGGHLTQLYNADVDYIDPGQTYYQYGFNVAYATQRPLFSYEPKDPTKAVPDLAAGQAKVSPDGKTVTIKIRKGVKFSPPVNREVTSSDVKYAIERLFAATVANGYTTYFNSIQAAPKAAKTPPNISGIQTPDKYTIVFKLTRPRGRVVVGALSLPGSAPVPKDYALKYDKQNPSAYGTHQVATGPYMIKNDPSGKLTGYTAGKQIQMVRNPNWKASTDYKPAYLDSITIKEGTDPTVGARTIAGGSHQISGDFQLPATTLQQGVTGKLGSRFAVTPPTGRTRWVAMNTRIKPFDNINVRKAVLAGFDRTALRQAFGGPVTGQVATHFIPPGISGFEDAGGAKGTGADFLANPNGDMALAAKYFKKAGYPSGKYTGKGTVQMVGDNASQQYKVAQVAQAQFKKLGFKTNLRGISRDAMLTSFCDVPKKEPPVCPNVGWAKDFPDPETSLDLTFNGKAIIPTNNSNWPLLNDPKINSAMARAEVLQDTGQRAKAWAQIDRQIVDQAPVIPWLWDTIPILESKDVNGVVNAFNAGWDLTYTSVK
jgi:peptide/nickel transport system substrate-binding protein